MYVYIIDLASHVDKIEGSEKDVVSLLARVNSTFHCFIGFLGILTWRRRERAASVEAAAPRIGLAVSVSVS